MSKRPLTGKSGWRIVPLRERKPVPAWTMGWTGPRAPITTSGWTRAPRTIETKRTSLIVDPPNGRIPSLTPEAEKRAEARRAYRREHPADSWEDRGLNDRCMFTTGLPIVPSAYNNNVQLFQTPDHVVMLIEMTHTLRVVPLNGGPHRDLRQFVGDSRGHWEGDTLVVETMNFHRLTGIRGSTPNARLVERFTRISPDVIQYRFTVEDADTWTRPWTAQRCT